MVFHPAKGNASNNSAAGVAPAPLKKVAPSVMTVRAPQGQGYGTAGDSNPSSLDPHQMAESSMAAVLREQQDPDGDLQRVVDGGSRAQVSTFQTRPVDPDVNVPAHPDMRNRKGEGGTVPLKCGYPSSEPVRIP